MLEEANTVENGDSKVEEDRDDEADVFEETNGLERIVPVVNNEAVERNDEEVKDGKVEDASFVLEESLAIVLLLSLCSWVGVMY